MKIFNPKDYMFIKHISEDEKAKLINKKLHAVYFGGQSSLLYFNMIKKKAKELGINTTIYKVEHNDGFRSLISKLCLEDEPSGIIVEHPLPKWAERDFLHRMMPPSKDLDIIGNRARGLFYSDMYEAHDLAPCTAKAAIRVLELERIPIAGHHVVIANRTNTVGRPLTHLFLRKDAHVTIIHSKTPNRNEIMKTADILCTAIGKPHDVDNSCIKKGAVVLDIGVSYDANGKLCGDVDPFNLTNPSFYTPVPGGVGAITTQMLLENFSILVNLNTFLRRKYEYSVY